MSGVSSAVSSVPQLQLQSCRLSLSIQLRIHTYYHQLFTIRMVYKEDWVLVNKVPTRVKTWGGWIDDPHPAGDPIIICIPGNPGISLFYHNFLASLHHKLIARHNRKVPVWTLCHAGHEETASLEWPRERSLYSLAGQVAHKVAFIKQYVPANSRVLFIGHSMGAKVISELLKDKQIADHTEKCYLLMPTLEKIADTPNGQFFTKVSTYLFSAIIFCAWVASMLPERCLRFLIRCWFTVSRQHNVDDNCMDAVCQLLQPRVLRRVLTLAMDEMERIKELDLKVIDTHCSKLKIYFSQADGWAPLSYMDSLLAANNKLSCAVLDELFYHAFVLDNPEEMADFLAEEIKSHTTL